ncbi:CD226 antigen [Aulostomus maculatus]
MEVEQKQLWYFVVLIFLSSLQGTVELKEAVIVPLKEGMVLKCLCPWSGNLTMVSWTKEPEKQQVAVFHPEYGVATPHHYRERIEFLRTTPMDGSISIKNVTHQDIGMYECSVQTFPQGPWTRTVQVEDLDEPPEEEEEEEEEDPTEEPPGPEMIKADAELSAEQSYNVTLGCKHKHNGTVHRVIVEWMQHGKPWSTIGVCKTVEGGIVGEDYSDRGRVSCADSLDVSVHLTGVEQEDAGFYRCIFNTDAGMTSTTVLLTVAPPGGFSLSVYMMYIYMGSGLAGLTLLIVILILTVRHGKKSRREEYRVKLHPSHKQVNYYENIHGPARTAKQSREIRNGPTYANLQWVRSQTTFREKSEHKHEMQLQM